MVPREKPLSRGDRNLTGHRGRQFDHPTLGSWVSYALGTANKNLPTFVNIGRPSSPVQLTGGYLGATVAATPFQPGETPIPNLYPPAGGSAAERERRMQTLADLNKDFREQYAINSDIAARAKAYELAARMQLSAPEVVDFANEPKHVQEQYGIGKKRRTISAGNCCSPDGWRNSGVRFIQICHAGGGNGSWDAHGDIKTHAPLCRATDKPIAGLIRDLKQRGMLDETLVVWSSEFGRSPWSQNTTGRDHNPRGYTVWLAGGGVKGGTVPRRHRRIRLPSRGESALLQRLARDDSEAARAGLEEDGGPIDRPDDEAGGGGRRADGGGVGVKRAFVYLIDKLKVCGSACPKC